MIQAASTRSKIASEYGEDRFIAIGMVGGRLLTVAYTERDGRIRIISARKATRREQDSYIIHNL